MKTLSKLFLSVFILLTSLPLMTQVTSKAEEALNVSDIDENNTKENDNIKLDEEIEGFIESDNSDDETLRHYKQNLSYWEKMKIGFLDAGQWLYLQGIEAKNWTKKHPGKVVLGLGTGIFIIAGGSFIFLVIKKRKKYESV